MLKASMPVEKGNEMIKSGAMQETLQSVTQQLRPEAAYFFPENGKRTALFVLDMEGSWQLPASGPPVAP